MNRHAITRTFLASAIAGAILAACGNSGVPVLQSVAASATARSPANHPLLYVADLGTSQVDVLHYPGGKPEAVLSGFATTNGLCTDFNGDVYVSDGHDHQLVEYPHDISKPMRTLKDPGYYMQGCAIDPRNGNLAVAIQSTSSGPGGIAIFRKAHGKPHNVVGYTIYFPSFCSYDNASNLYFDGTDTHGMFVFAEMPAGTNQLRTVTLDQSIVIPGGVQWDGKYLAVGDQGAGYKGSTIYQFSMSGSTGTKVGTTPLNGSSDVISFWIEGNRVVGPNIGSSPNVMYWKYPEGGNAIKTMTGFTEPVGVVVSELPSR